MATFFVYVAPQKVGNVHVFGSCGFTGKGVFSGGILWVDSDNNAEDGHLRITDCQRPNEDEATLILGEKTILRVKGTLYKAGRSEGLINTTVTEFTLNERDVMKPVE